MDWLSPWTITTGLVGLLFGGAFLVLLVANRRQISAQVSTALRRIFSPVGFFGLVILVFLGISTLEAGQYFDTNITHHAVFGLLGYALALGFDLVSVACLQARLNATRMHDDRGAHLNLLGVCICAAVSAFANLAGALEGYEPANLSRTPLWLQVCAPWTSVVFPLLIVILSMTADHLLDHTPTSDIDVHAYRTREQKRVEMLQVRLETERALARLEGELTTLRQERNRARGRREWIWMQWLRPVVPGAEPPVFDQAALAQHMHDVHTTLTTLRSWTAEVTAQLHTLQTQVQELHTPSVPAQAHLTAPAHPHAPRQQTQHIPAQDLDGEQVNARILAAFRQLGMSAKDTEVARLVGCSRTTVGRWRKRALAQGQEHTAEPTTPAGEQREQGASAFQENHYDAGVSGAV